MTPRLRKKHTSSILNFKEIQLTSNALDSKQISRTRHIDNELKLKDNAKVMCTRSVTLVNGKRKAKNDNTNLQVMDNTLNEKRRSTRSSKLLKSDINNKTKFVKSIVHNGIIHNEQKVVGKKRKVNKILVKDVSNLKQISLKDSFLNMSKIKALRSYKNSKDIKNNSVSKETLSKKLSANKKKTPIYEPLSPQNNREASSEVYEFKFDVNDSKERLPAKRKKKGPVKKTLGTKKKKNVSSKQNVQQTKVQKKKLTVNKFSEAKDIDPMEENKNSVKPQMENEKRIMIGNILTGTMKNKLTNADLSKPKNEIKSENTLKSKNMVKPENVVRSENVNNISKPRIVSVECIGDTKVTMKDTARRSNSDDFKPFRPTNIFSNRFTLQQKNAFNSSVFEKSLSPILKTSENVDIISPWRSSPLCTFSQMKNVFQSTPQNTKFDICTKKYIRTLNNESVQKNQTNVRSNLKIGNENISIDDSVMNNTPKLKTSTLRKFGTEITNLDHSLQSNTVDPPNEKMATDLGHVRSNVVSASLDISKTNNVIQFQNNERDKYSNPLKLQKTFKKEVKHIIPQNNQKNIMNTLADNQKENFDPQPGPSGLQTHLHFNDQRILRQSNLNNFLNIMELPQTTTVRTPHGIFDDVKSASINGRSMNNTNDSRMLVENAFGFNDTSDQDIPLTQSENTNIKMQNAKQIARLSFGQINNMLIHNKHEHNKESMQIEEKEKNMNVKGTRKPQIDVANFTDTFDILSETGNTSVASVSDVPLFFDYEPTHFTQPPRHSYKRKRVLRYSFSEEENENEEEKFINNAVKRKKKDKFNKEQEQRLREWVQNINKTFTEIDEHELVIE